MQEVQREIDKSEFNMGVAILKRIDMLLNNASWSAINRNLHQWFDILMALLIQVKYLLNEPEEAENKKYLEALTKLDNEYVKFSNANRMKDFKDYGTYHKSLGDYETFLRDCLDRRDLLMKKKSRLGEAVFET